MPALTALANDAAPEVRACVARAAGFSQQPELAEVLAKLLVDKEVKIRQAAAMSLLSFSPKNAAISAIFRANLENEEFKPLFLIALARERPGDYLNAIAKAVEKKTEPKQFWVGRFRRSPRGKSSSDIFRLSQSTAFALESLTAISTPWRKWATTLRRSRVTSMPSTCMRGMTERAQRFRREANKAATYNLDYFFKQVDENPSLYRREQKRAHRMRSRAH